MKIMVAAGSQFDNAILYDIEGLVILFKGVSNGKKNFVKFCKGEYAWVYPNASLARFNYCPITGEPIDWEQIMKAGLKLFDD